MTKRDDDDLPQVNGTSGEKPDQFRGRESDEEETHDEGLPSVNRKKKSNKVTSYIIIGSALLVGLLLIVKLNSSPKVKKVDESKAIVTNNLPSIDTTPPPPPAPPVSAPATASFAPPPLANAGQQNGGAGQPPAKGPNGKPIVHWSDRKLGGDLVIKSQGQQKASNANAQAGGRVPNYDAPGQATATTDGGGLGGGNSAGQNNLSARLTGTPTPSVSASLLKNRDFLLAKGSSLDCAMDSAIDTSLPGIMTCTLTTDVYSDNNHTLLLERGTRLDGEQQGNVKQGQARVFALWNRARTPNGVVINLTSPGADSLGRSGLEGWVDTHFAERFGAAILMSFIQSTLDYAVASQESNSPTTIIGDSANSGEDVIGKILDSTINIPPTILKNQGDHINIIVARDLDFSTVYELQAN